MPCTDTGAIARPPVSARGRGFGTGSRLCAALLLALASLLTSGCASDDASAPDTSDLMRDWLEAVRAESGADAALVEGAPPPGGAGPPITAALSSAFLAGGTAELRVASSDTIDGLILGAADADAFIAVQLGGPDTAAELLVTLRRMTAEPAFELRVAATRGDNVGPYTEFALDPLDVPHGPIEVSLSWDSPADLDLHVVEPDETEIHAGDPASGSGGELDLTSNNQCVDSPTRSEHAVWEPADSPLPGEYRVRVGHSSSCGAESTEFIVTIRVAGERTRVVTGRFTGDGSGGGAGAGSVVARFDF